MNTTTSAIRQQFNEAPYPNFPFSYTTKENFSLLFCNSITTSYYLRSGKVISPKEKWILDAGCGSGETTQALIEANPGAKVIGVDLSENSIDVANSRILHHGYQNDVTFYAMPLEEVGKLNIAFDYINCHETLYLLPDPLAGLKAMKAVLKPTGIIRANLHSFYQRDLFFRAQEAFRKLGIDLLPQAEQLTQARTVLNALYKTTTLRSVIWPNPEVEDIVLLSNHLLVGDKGFTIENMFELLEGAGLELISLTNWLKWNVVDLFSKDQIPESLAVLLEFATEREKLHLYELLNPVHRLIDFWCGHSQPLPEEMSEQEWTDQEWLQVTIHLLPALRTAKFKTDLDVASRVLSPLLINDCHHTLQSVGISDTALFCIRSLWDEPKTVEALVHAFMKAKPVDWQTLAPFTFAEVFENMRRSILNLHQYLFVLMEKQV